MDSNADHAVHGDLIEITNTNRVDFGKRMQVATTGDIAVTALDNRVRVQIYHDDYKIVRRCGRPGSSSAAQPSKTAPARAVAEAPKVERPPITEDEAVAKLEAAIAPKAAAIDVPVTRKVAPSMKAAEMTEQAARNQQARALADRAAGVDIDKPHDKTEAQVTVPSSDVSPEAYAALHADRIAREADYFADCGYLTQEQFDAMTRQTEPRGFVAISAHIPARKYSHYFKDVSQFDQLDVYRVIERFNVTDPCLQHAIKKLLVAGGRGAKDAAKDVQEAIDALERFKDMRDEEQAAA